MRVLFADDHEMVRETIATALRTEPDLQVETAPDLFASLRALTEGKQFDLVMLDYLMPGMQGLCGLDAVLKAAPRTPVALVSGMAPAIVARQALARGAAGYLPKSLSLRSLIAAMRFIVSGEIYAPMSLLNDRAVVHTAQGEVVLTDREFDVMKGLTAGKGNKEIAINLGLQEVTVKLHVKTLYRKIGARNRTHAAMIARQSGLC